MNSIESLIRENIRALKPYSSARDEFSGSEGVFLDANENPYGNLNRYPDPYQKALKEKLSQLKSIPSKNIFIGNGSDEIIDLVFRVFCEPRIDKVITFPPSYGMYEVSAGINNVDVVNVPLKPDFQIDFEEFFSITAQQKNIKIVFVCSPNNPTGNSLDNIETLLENSNTIVVVDEAYIDFSERPSLVEKLQKYPNLIVSQTFSKALGLAAARVGVAYANEEIVALLNKVKPPYNVSVLNQKAALDVLKNYSLVQDRISLILNEKEQLINQLLEFDEVFKIYPSDANFLLVEFKNANDIYEKLIKHKIIVRNRNSIIKNCIRITVGTPEENKQLINKLKNSN